MKIPYNWLKELVPSIPSPEVVADLLTGIGLSVEAVIELPGCPDNVVVVEVQEVSQVPGSDTLAIVKVSDGQQIYSVVCSVPGLRIGIRTALALPKAKLPSLDDFVGVRTIAGYTSNGVLCSPGELGLYDYNSGLIEFNEDAPLGASLATLWPGETILELELTPNRADALSILGVARDLAAKLQVPYNHPAATLQKEISVADDTDLTAKVETTNLCPRMTLRLVEDVEVKPSPLWIQHRLASVGIVPRNNIVDVTNYVTFELGQPSHAYDLDKVSAVSVRMAKQGEQLRVFGGQNLQLQTSDLVIASHGADTIEAPVALAGVIGSEEHSISKNTKAVLLEVAHFNPVTVRRAAKRHKLITDAHYRFERGVDPNLPPVASARIAKLLEMTASGKAQTTFMDTGSDITRAPILYRPSRLAYITALDVPEDLQKRFLESLGCTVDGSVLPWTVTPPSWRFDLALEEDLVEEIARLHGYEYIPETFPSVRFVPGMDDVTHRSLRSYLANTGFQEVLNYVFVNPNDLNQLGASGPYIEIDSPLNAERSVLRTSLWAGLLSTAKANREEPNLALFEIGSVFGFVETERLGILLKGNWIAESWLPGKPVDFYLLKGILEALANASRADLRLKAHPVPGLHPGASAEVSWNGAPIGVIGRAHPEVEHYFGVGETYLAELDLPLQIRDAVFRDFSRQPSAERDLAVIVPQDFSFSDLESIIRSVAGPQLYQLIPFDVYQGDQIGQTMVSIGIRLSFRHEERALRDEEVDFAMMAVITAVKDAGLDIRG